METGRRLLVFGGNKISPLRSVANKDGLQVCLALVFLEWIMVWSRDRGL